MSEQLHRALALARELKRRRPWVPLPGPQSLAYESEADITGYGGAAGGGKTDLLAGLVLTKHKRSLIVRREKAQTEGVIQRLEEIVGHKDGFNSQKAIWKLPLGAAGIVEFAGLDNPGDERRWQGRPHDLKCVGAGTPIWMADGTTKPVEAVVVGDEVYTLLGPRRVTRTMRATRPAVRVSVEGYSQIQAANHPLLVAPCPAAPVSPTRRRSARLSGRTCEWTSLSPLRPPEARREGQRTACVSGPGAGPREPSPGSSGGKAHRDRGTAAEGTSATGREHELRASPPRVRLVLLERQPGQAEGDCAQIATKRGARDELSPASLPGFQAGCPSVFRYGGAQSRPSEEDGQRGPYLQDGAAPQSPTCSQADGRPQTPKRSPRTWSWVHPYRMETYRTDHPARAVHFDVEDVGEQPLFDLTVEGANHYVAGPGIVNRNCFDEATEMRETQVRFIMGWTRTSDPKVRPRVILTFNPPTTAEGRWVIAFFAPWLDKKHPNPAMPGELRWFTTIADKDEEVPDGRPFVLVGGERVYEFDPKDHKPEAIIRPKSRTFIPARLTDNKFYMATDYMSQLQALPEPLRSQMLNGDFSAGIEDDIWQVIPTRWVEIAQARWKKPDKLPEMDSMGVDVARGGKDSEVIARRHDMWFDEPLVEQGESTNSGPKVAGRVIASQRDHAVIHIDVIGVGASPYDFLNDMGQQVIGVNVAEKSGATDKSGRLFFQNLRSELWWKMREALDPEANNGIALPPDPRLLADLCAPKWSVQGSRIYVESREQIVERIGRSPDFASAYCLALMDTPKMRHMMRTHNRAARDYDPMAYRS